MFGITETTESLYKIAEALNLPKERVDKVVQEELEAIKPQLEFYREKFEGMTCLCYVGAPRTWHWVMAMKDLGIDYVVACTTFGHEEDYEKINRNLKRAGIKGVIIIDAPNELELEEAIKTFQPDFMLTGVKERYLFRKYGVPTISSHSYEQGPYVAYRGFVNFARDIYKAVYHPIWKVLREGEKKFEPFKGGGNGGNMLRGKAESGNDKSKQDLPADWSDVGYLGRSQRNSFRSRLTRMLHIR